MIRQEIRHTRDTRGRGEGVSRGIASTAHSGTVPMSRRKVSAQVHTLQAVCTLCNESSDKPGFNLDTVASQPVLRSRNIPKNSISHALKRFLDLHILSSPGTDTDGKKLYRVKNLEWAIAYIAGDPDKPWTPLTPTPQTTEFTDYDEHRAHFDVGLTSDWYGRIQGVSEVKNGQCTFRTKGFTLSVNEKSLKGQLFIRPYWREEVKHKIGEDFYQYVHGLETKNAMNGDFCLPLDMKGGRFFVGGRPVQLSGSHYENQLDIRAAKNDKNIRQGIEGILDQADFNVRILDNQDAILDALQKQGEVQSKIAETLQKVIRQLSPEQSYQAPPEEKGGFEYR